MDYWSTNRLMKYRLMKDRLLGEENKNKLENPNETKKPEEKLGNKENLDTNTTEDNKRLRKIR